MDYTTYGSADILFDIMGFGAAPTNPSPWPTPHSPASRSARR